jgi:hypothetical protein
MTDTLLKVRPTFMANEQYAFIQKGKVPSRVQWQEAVDTAGFDLQIYPELQVFEHSGFMPCKVLGKDSGVEMYYSSANEIFGDPAATEALAGNRDYCISFRWGGSFREAACAMILSYALASSFGAVVSYEGEEPQQDLTALRKETDDILKEAAKEK